MALTVNGENAAINGATAKMAFVSMYGFPTSGAEPKFKPTSGTAIGASLITMTGAKAKGFTNGRIVMIRKLTAAVTGLVAERPYYIVGEVTNGFELAKAEGGAAVKVAGHELEADTEIIVLQEAAVARIATAWGAASEGEATDAERIIKVKAGWTVTDACWWEKLATGSGATGVFSVQKLTEPEAYSAEGEYKLTSDKLEQAPTVA
jgi:hypothetical protein